MKRNRIVALFLALAMMLSPCATAASDGNVEPAISAEFTEADNATLIQDNCMRYFPFIYSEDDDFAWHREFIGNCNECISGYLYVQDLETKEIWQVLNQPVDEFISHESMLYCIVNGTIVIRTNFFGANTGITYVSAYGTLANISLNRTSLLLTDESHVVSINLSSGNAVDLVECENIINIVPVSENSFAWTNTSYETYLYDIKTGIEVPVDLDNLDCGEMGLSDGDVASFADGTYTASVLTPEVLPLSNYPSGSYFTKNGTACTDHGGAKGNPCKLDNSCNCLMHEGAIQCAGFAKYAFEQYSHISKWISASDDTGHRDLNVSIKTKESLLTFLQTIETGSYLRLMRTDKPAKNDGHHSIIVAGYSSSSIIIYDCNWTGACQVSYRIMSLEDFVKKFNKIVNCVSHNYSVFIQQLNDPYYHRVVCSYDGCSGFILVNHRVSGAGEGTVCVDCGYVNPLSFGVSRYIEGAS